MIPLFNEEKRLKLAFRNIDQIIKSNFFSKLEVIFVNDGSNDHSLKIIKNYIDHKKKLRKLNFRIISFNKNQGKGLAIKKGFLASKNKWVLTTDVDFSVSLLTIIKWIKMSFIKKNINIYFGSRGLKDSIVHSSYHRVFLGNLFKILVRIFLKISIKDTQCGFKLYKKNVARIIFLQMKHKEFDHDLEIVLLAKRHKILIKELPVHWKHIKQSKINLLLDSLKMILGIIRLSVLK